MQVGSLIVRTPQRGVWDNPKKYAANNKGLQMCIAANYQFPAINEIYTVREICRCKVTGMQYILIDELQNPPIRLNGELVEIGFSPAFFKELQKPMDIAALLSEPDTQKIK